LSETKNILIAGGSGLLGKHLADYSRGAGFHVYILSRNPSVDSKFKRYAWNPTKGILDSKVLQDKDIIINLSGAGIGEKIWTSKRKKTLYNSRITSTRLLVDTLIKEKIKPKLFINASAIGYYGNRPFESLTETSSQGVGFLSSICSNWENEVRRLDEANISYSILRIGIVLSNQGGSFPKLILPIKNRLNLVFGKGDQYISWIHIDDMVKIIFSIATGGLRPEIYNCVSPNPVTQKNLNDVLKIVSSVKTIQVKLSKKLLSLIIGDMSELLLSDLKVSPENLLKQNFQYTYPDINSSIKHLLKNPNS